ncbi:MAG: hypothetical protein WB502_14535 [Thermoactinomyces sp.]
MVLSSGTPGGVSFISNALNKKQDGVALNHHEAIDAIDEVTNVELEKVAGFFC